MSDPIFSPQADLEARDGCCVTHSDPMVSVLIGGFAGIVTGREIIGIFTENLFAMQKTVADRTRAVMFSMKANPERTAPKAEFADAGRSNYGAYQGFRFSGFK